MVVVGSAGGHQDGQASVHECARGIGPGGEQVGVILPGPLQNFEQVVVHGDLDADLAGGLIAKGTGHGDSWVGDRCIPTRWMDGAAGAELNTPVAGI